LERVIGRCDVVIIGIEINSHGGAILAKKCARRLGRPSVMVRKPSVSALHRALEQLQLGPAA
jgi:adenine/guanine phosphoribosyltransferase-like PRPP-binding protein